MSTTETIGLTRKAHVLAEFACSICGGPCLRMAIADVGPDGLIAPTAIRTDSMLECNNCIKVKHEKEEKERADAILRRSFAKGTVQKKRPRHGDIR